MLNVFVEYEVAEELRNRYFAIMRPIIKEKPGLELLESRDRPGLFLEIWKGFGEEQATAFKLERLDGANSLWAEINRLATGGCERIRIWCFRRTDTYN